jgi:hypothetical protein
LETLILYLKLGYTHVIPLGFDHILFILTLFFLNSKLKTVVLQCSVFTLAHSLTLGLVAFGLFMPNVKIIEVLIALSILFTAVENIVTNTINPFRLLIVFAFGLVHGMGFANALLETGLPKEQFISSLLSFNFGVELGQLVVIVSAYFLVSKWFSNKVWYKERIIYPISVIIGCVAFYWTIERVLSI